MTALPRFVAVALHAGPSVSGRQRFALSAPTRRVGISRRVTRDARALRVARHTRRDVSSRPPHQLGVGHSTVVPSHVSRRSRTGRTVWRHTGAAVTGNAERLFPMAPLTARCIHPDSDAVAGHPVRGVNLSRTPPTGVTVPAIGLPMAGAAEARICPGGLRVAAHPLGPMGRSLEPLRRVHQFATPLGDDASVLLDDMAGSALLFCLSLAVTVKTLPHGRCIEGCSPRLPGRGSWMTNTALCGLVGRVRKPNIGSRIVSSNRAFSSLEGRVTDPALRIDRRGHGYPSCGFVALRARRHLGNQAFRSPAGRSRLRMAVNAVFGFGRFAPAMYVVNRWRPAEQEWTRIAGRLCGQHSADSAKQHRQPKCYNRLLHRHKSNCKSASSRYRASLPPPAYCSNSPSTWARWERRKRVERTYPATFPESRSEN